ncbi:MAG TPA: hypothetical protein PKW79_03650, partial [Rhabdochlamydiaceae bacterium]|nr:hypothetical protein [Rhabdochlamydiaceae bacterium]
MIILLLFIVCFFRLEGSEIVRSTKQIVLDDYPGAFNPSIVQYEDGFLFTFRYCPDVQKNAHISYIGVVRLNRALEPISPPQLLSTRFLNNKTPSQSEDARIFIYRGRYFLIYNDNMEDEGAYRYHRRDMFMAELTYRDSFFRLSMPIKLIHEEKYWTQLWQKNWVPFDWHGNLLIIYTVSPHEIVFPNLLSGICYPAYNTWRIIDWQWGPLRCSAPPQLVDGVYLTFFHSGCVTTSPASHGWNLWHYFMGAYTFSSEPPFQILTFSKEPITADEFYTQSGKEKRVVFPGGFVVDGNYIYLAYGKDDDEMWIA